MAGLSASEDARKRTYVPAIHVFVRAYTHKSPSHAAFRANRTLSRHRRMTESDPQRKSQLIPALHNCLDASDQGSPDLLDPLSMDRTGLATENIKFDPRGLQHLHPIHVSQQLDHLRRLRGNVARFLLLQFHDQRPGL